MGEPRQRAILAALLVDAGRPVSVDTLVDRVWGDSPPPQARRSLQAHVARIRRVLQGAADAESGEAGGDPVPQPLVRSFGGYVIATGIAQVDALRFRDLVAQVRPATVDERLRASRLREALGLWRGEPLAGVNGRWAARMRQTWQQEHIDATVMWARTEIRRGNASAALGPLTDLAEEHPTLEAAATTLMWALYAAGRPSDALDRYERIRKRLRDGLGADPGPELHASYQAVLRHDMTMLAGGPAQPAEPATPVPEQLPADVSAFTGRTGELAKLDRLLTESAPLCITGTAGVGKTTLAVRWAHRMAGRFPDGQLYVNLRGFDPAGTPTPPAEAIRDVLDALGVPTDQVPASPAAQAALYRTRLTGRRVLVLLDNAYDADQVRPLLPGSAGPVVLVTSRSQLTGLLTAGAHHVNVDLLPATEAVDLLAQRIGGHRIAAEPVAARQIVDQCARLPLALAVVAARATTQSGFSLASLAAELSEAQRGLDGFDGGDATTDLRAVFASSYQRLGAPEARMFRLLGLHPGPDIAAAAAADLATTSQPRARSALAALARAHLITEHSPGRFALHDLLRRYAGELARTLDPDVDRRAALRRLNDHYVRLARHAAALVDGHGAAYGDAGPVGNGAPRTPEQALSWYNAERRALLAVLQHAAATGMDTHLCELAWALTELFDLRGHWHDWAATASLALDAAQRLDDRTWQARLHRSHARVDVWLGNAQSAQAHAHRAIDLYREVGDRIGLAHTYRTLCWFLGRQGAHREAAGNARTAVDLHRAAGDRAGQGLSLNSLGWQHANLGEHTLALRYCREAVSLLSDAGDSRGLGYALDSLGYIHHRLGEHTAAVANYREAITLFRQTGDRYQEADTLVRLGDTHQHAGDLDEAESVWWQAVDILDALRHRDAERVRLRLDEARRGWRGHR